MRTHSRASTRTACWTAVALLLFAVAVPAKEDEFKAVVNHISAQYRTRPMPFMGLLGFVANRFTPDGVSDMKFAIFEDLDSSRGPDGVSLDAFVQAAAARTGFQPFVRVVSMRGGEQSLIYARPSGRKIEMFIVTIESDEAVVLRMKLNPEAMSSWIDDPIGSCRDSTRYVRR